MRKYGRIGASYTDDLGRGLEALLLHMLRVYLISTCVITDGCGYIVVAVAPGSNDEGTTQWFTGFLKPFNSNFNNIYEVGHVWGERWSQLKQ